MGNSTHHHMHEEISADDLTIMTIFIRNSHQMPSTAQVLVQASLFLISFFVTLFGVSTALRFSVFHINQRNIFISLLLLWFELLLCRCLIWAFKYHLAIEIREGTAFHKENRNHPLLSEIDCHDACHHYGRCSFTENGLEPIFVAGIMRYHYMYFVVSTPIAILTERIFATILVKDYEKKNRHWIFCLIFLCQNVFASAMSAITTTMGVTFQVMMCAVFLALIAAGVIYYLVEYFNQRRLLILEHDPTTQYTLSIRYQLKENLKTLKLMRRFFLTIIFFIIGMGLAHSLPVILNFDEHVIMNIRVYMDYIFHSDPLIVVPAAFLTIENYRVFAFNKVKTTFGMRTDSHKVDIRKLRPGMERETDVYFENFEKQLEEGNNRKKRHGTVKKPNCVKA